MVIHTRVTIVSECSHFKTRRIFNFNKPGTTIRSLLLVFRFFCGDYSSLSHEDPPLTTDSRKILSKQSQFQTVLSLRQTNVVEVWTTLTIQTDVRAHVHVSVDFDVSPNQFHVHTISQGRRMSGH